MSGKREAPSKNKKTAVVRGGEEGKKKSRREEAEEPKAGFLLVLAQVAPYLLILLALFIFFCLFAPETTGFVGGTIQALITGCFSRPGYLFPVLLICAAGFFHRDLQRRMLLWKALFILLFQTFLSALFYVKTAVSGAEFSPLTFWNDGLAGRGGGLFGNVVCWLLNQVVGMVGVILISAFVLFICGIFLIGSTPHEAVLRIRFWLHERAVERQDRILEKRKAGQPATLREIIVANLQKRRKERREIRAEERAARQAKDQLDLETRRSQTAAAAEEVSEEKTSQASVSAANSGEKQAAGEGGQTEASPAESQPYEPDNAAWTMAQTLRQAQAAGGIPNDGGEPSVNHRDFDPFPPTDIHPLWDRTPEDFGGAEGSQPTVSSAADAPSEEAASGQRVLQPVASQSISAEPSLQTTVSPAVHEGSRTSAAGHDGKGDASSTEIDALLQTFLANSEGGEGRAVRDEADELGTDGLPVSRRTIGGEAEPLPPPPPPTYVFPPTTLLAVPVVPQNTDVSAEMKTTSEKLVSTLASFKVRTRIVNVSRGPTITRYELCPEEGVRVRAISNLVDDISLGLASTGVRIEAPIPGKSAVGIEVPNRVVATVYLRELVESPKFTEAASRVTVALGKDVAGEPVFVDIAKMPHLLIAGATGMGKSVCINSMLVSMLYKATPDDVRLILIDPKKVELNIYNGLPHLLIPVVTDPKKAAGSLQWAVGEMERRFNLIEEVGVRDLKSYNKAIEHDPEHEHLPQILIVIDELADLMMTAPDDVEESICRLAQKARAAGMHLLIGTQRPSVDVITGLIKANVPSRIAFTVASQVDSRTIIDISGAEKLIGRGDMLYAPVGSAKPIRVQGAFVSEGEIEAVISFIKQSYGMGSYDSSIIESIEREAQRCGNNKKLSADSGDDGMEEQDQMLKPAIELAVECGKISTSLIQRRLSLGYGRAAKLIDHMEKLGIVSAPDGQKPRTVLITRQQYMEMVLNRDITE